jgi:hypothetical protein
MGLEALEHNNIIIIIIMDNGEMRIGGGMP